MVKGFPVVLSDRGAPFVAVEKNAPLATVAENGRGLPIRLVEKGAPPIILQGGAPWTPIDLFADGTDGTLWETWDISMLFQDQLGTTPVTAGGDPVRLVLDKSRGLAPGTDRFTNSDFSQWSGGSPVGWTVGGTVNASNYVEQNANGLRFVSNGTLIHFYQNGGGTGLREVEADVTIISGSLRFSNSTGGDLAGAPIITASGVYKFYVTTGTVGLKRGSSVEASEAIVHKFSLREIATVPLSQSVLANSFTAVNSGSVWGIVSDYAGDVLSATLPFAIDGAILIAGTGGTIIEPVSYAASSTFNLGPASYTGGAANILQSIGTVIGVVMLDREFTSDEAAQLLSYYQKKGAGGLL